MAGVARLALGVAVGLVPSCALDSAPAGVGDDPAASDPAADEDTSSEPVCTVGRYLCHSRVRTQASGVGLTPYAAAPRGFGPADLQAAYRIDPDTIPSPTPVIALVDAYGYPALQADLAVYRAQYGLPPCTVDNGCLRIVNQNGQTSPLPPPPPANNDWTLETALDLDVASAACPKCKLLVVQANDNTGEGMFLAQNVAARLGATVISNSWGGTEDPSPTEMQRVEAFFNHPGVAIFSAAGDAGYNNQGMGPDYPSTSAYVISVGGTHLVRDASARGWSETAWSNGGSSCSLSIPKPDYQSASPCRFKATVDIAAVGDPVTGMAIYNAGKWGVAGGTSASAPFVAGLWAASGNGAQTSGAYLAANIAKLNDITTGSNGTCGASRLLCNAAPGWDGPTGFGTPNGQALVPPGTTLGSSDGSDGSDGGGGCSAGGSAGAAMLFGLALVAWPRRRRR